LNKLNIAENIARLRHEKKITQEQLAEFIGVTKASVSKWENGQNTPDIILLPQLAAFFGITVDELIGYEPQLSKEQIQHLYKKFGKDFCENPFEQVMEETKIYVKRYYSCFPFLLQICILWLNHCMMAENEEKQKEIWESIASLCEHIKSNCRDIQIYNTAVVVQAIASLQTGRIQEVLPELEDITASGRFSGQTDGVLVQAYTVLGKQERADEFIQGNMYSHLISLLSNAGSYLSIHADNPSICGETIRRAEQIAEIYNLMELNPNNLAVFEYQAAVCRLTQGERQSALGHIEKYVQCLSRLFSTDDIHLHGDEYFYRLEEWCEKELDNGTNPPRNRKAALKDAKNTLDVPPFTTLAGDPAWEKLKKKLKELS